MTDKQIIIDGTHCRYASFDGGNTQRLLCAIDDCFCDGFRTNECYYKQLKRKEQECEELKEEIARARMEICNQCGEKDDYNIPCKQIRDLDYGLQLEIEENDKLSKTLTEIKEIAQYDVYTSRTDLCLKLNWIKKKISEYGGGKNEV